MVDKVWLVIFVDIMDGYDGYSGYDGWMGCYILRTDNNNSYRENEIIV